jgi:hypothetical protein
MYHARLMTRGSFAFGMFLSLALLVPVSEAQFKVTDNFNRSDGAVGLGWSNWGNGAQISGNQLETFGEIDVAGGITRTLDVTFPLNFSFDFSTSAPTDGGWLIGFNAAGTVVVTAGETSEFELRQYRGSTGLCNIFQTSSGATGQCGNPKTGQRDFTATAHIFGTINADFSAAATITYNDGLTPPTITLRIAAPVGAIQNPMGSVFFFGNANATAGPHFFDNFSLTLK